MLSKEEMKLSDEFINNGYIIRPVLDTNTFESMTDFIFKTAVERLNVKQIFSNKVEFFNSIHKFLNVDDLNEFRLYMISSINEFKNFREFYFKISDRFLEILVGNELSMQKKLNLSIQMPNDNSSLLPIHADTWSGDSPFEIVVWLPLVDCFKTKTMFILPPDYSQELEKDFFSGSITDSDVLFKKIKNKVIWLKVNYGEVLIFNQNLPHGNVVNTESETRWSMNCRFKGIFTPYNDKKIGEFFEPITLRAMSKIGINYKMPNIKKSIG